MAYTLYIDGLNKTTFLKAQSLNINKNIESSSCYFTLVIDALNLGTADGIIIGKDVKFYEDSEILFGGVVKTIDIQRYECGTGNETTILASVLAEDYNEIPSRRFTSDSFSDTTAGAVVEAMVDVMNVTGADDNIGIGLVLNGATIPVYEYNIKSVKEVLDEMAEASGYKWYIDESKDLYFVKDSTVNDSIYDLREDDTFKDFYVESLNVSTENYRNKQWVKGTLGVDGNEVFTSSTDSTQINDRADIENSSGVYGNLISATELQTLADATEIASNGLRNFGTMPYIITFTTQTNVFRTGNKLVVNLPSMTIRDDMYFLIETVNIVDLGCAILESTVTASRRKENNFATQPTDDYKKYFKNLLKNQNTNNNSYAQKYAFAQDSPTITASNTQNISVTLNNDSNVMCHATLKCNASTNLVASLDLQLDSTTIIDTDYQLASGNNTIVFNYPSFQTQNGSRLFSLVTSVSTGTLTVSDLMFWINADGIADGASSAYPSAEIFETWDVTGTISSLFSSFGTDSVTATTQLPTSSIISETWDITSTVSNLHDDFSDSVTSTIT